MANDAERNKKIQQDIAKAIKDQTQSLKDFTTAQKNIVELKQQILEKEKAATKLLEEQNKLLAQHEDFERDATEEEKRQLAYLTEQLETQKDQLKVLKGNVRELARTKNLLRAGLNELKGWGQTMGSQLLPSFNQILDKTFGFDEAVRKTAISAGITGQRFKLMSDQLDGARFYAEGLNISQEELTAAAGSYSEALGRQVILSSQSLEIMAETARATGLSVEALGQLTGEMEAFGLGGIQAANTIMSIRDASEQMGINSGKVIKKFESNLSLLNKLDFKGGVKGLAKMAAHSEKFKLSMEAVAGVSDKVFRPEGAIEAAAKLQVLGGSLSQLGDPFQLMYKARHAPEELAKSISSAAAQSAVFNEATGEFEVGALELDRMREAADALGMDYTELVKTAKQTAKINMFEDSLKGVQDNELKEYISGIADMTKDGAQISFYDKNMKQVTKKLENLNKSDLDLIKKQKEDIKERKELAEQAQSVREQWQGVINQFLVKASQTLLPMFQEGGWIRDLVTSIKDFINNPPAWIKSFDKLGGLIENKGGLAGGLLVFSSLVGKPLLWFMRGRMLGKGFQSQTEKGGFFKKLGQKMNPKNWFKKKGAQTLTQQVSGGLQSTVGSGQNAAQTLASGKASKAAGMGSMMKSLGSAANILAIGAALMMLAKAVDIFADAMIKLKEVDPKLIAGVGVGLLVFVGAMALIGSVGKIAEPVMLAVGAALLMIGGAVWLAAEGISTMANSFTTLMTSIGGDGSSLMKAGLGFGMMAMGIYALSGALLALSATSLLALPGLMLLGAATSMLVGTAQALEGVGGGDGITKSIDAINSVDQEKINSLKELASMMSFWGMFGGNVVTVEFGDLSVKGNIDIEGEGGGKSSTDWVEDPIFVRKLKGIVMEALQADKKGYR